jgi:hypothetical protein
MKSCTDASALVKAYSQYGLRPFSPILTEILTHFETLDDLRDRTVLELGPGNRVELMRFLAQETAVKSIQGAGKSIVWPWTRHKAFIRTHVVNARLLDFLAQQQGAASYDLIYSRLVMEQHSIDPWILFASKAYRQQFKKRRFVDFDESYPASIPNLQAVFRRAWILLKPGGVIISHIGKRKYSALDRSFLDELKPRQIYEQDLGRFSRMVTLLGE